MAIPPVWLFSKRINLISGPTPNEAFTIAFSFMGLMILVVLFVILFSGQTNLANITPQ